MEVDGSRRESQLAGKDGRRGGGRPSCHDHDAHVSCLMP